MYPEKNMYPWNEVRKGVTEVIIEEGITTIPDKAFYEFSLITRIVIPTTVNEIGKSVFSGCRSLKTIIIKSNITSIGEYAFFLYVLEEVHYYVIQKPTCFRAFDYDYYTGVTVKKEYEGSSFCEKSVRTKKEIMCSELTIEE